MKRPIVIVAVALLVAPAVASAKEISAVTVCGASGCTTYQQPDGAIASGGDGFPDLAPAPAPYYTLRLEVDEAGPQDAWTIFYVPRAGVVAFAGESGRIVFERPSSAFRELVQRYAAGLQPYPPPTVTTATVGGRAVEDPQSYLSLFTEPPSGEAHPIAHDFVPIRLRASRPSPWTDSRYLMFSPSTGALERGTSVIPLAPATVQAIKAGESLDGAAPESDSRFDWPLVTGTLAAVLVLALATLLLMRRGRPAPA